MNPQEPYSVPTGVVPRLNREIVAEVQKHIDRLAPMIEDTTPLKDYLEPQFRAASDSDASVTYRLHFEPPLPVSEKSQEALVQRLTRLVSPVAHVLAVVAEKKS